MSSTNMSRRTLVAGVATIPAATVLASPIATTTADAEPDPIYAVIEKYQAINAAFLARCHHEDDLAEAGHKLILAPGDYRTPEMVAVVTASIAARSALANTSPTTLAGLAAQLSFVLSQSDELGEFLFESPEEPFDGTDQVTTFVRSLERAVRRIAAEQTVQS